MAELAARVGAAHENDATSAVDVAALEREPFLRAEASAGSEEGIAPQGPSS